METEIKISACGICCSVCKMFKLENCYCFSGTDSRAKNKLKIQKDKLGDICKILACAVEKKISYCPRDCKEFPCILYQSESRCYPYSNGFLKMIKFRSHRNK